MRKLKRKQLF